MRNITKYILISACTLMLNSCDAYLDKQPDDAMTMEMIFQKAGFHSKILGKRIQLYDRRISYGTEYSLARSIG
mgnify:CR=1 FL=1